MMKKLLLVCAAFAMTGSFAAAQESTNRVAAETDWSVFVDEGPKECWAVSAPKETVNTRNGQVVSVNRSEILLFVFDRPSAGVKGQVTFTGGYPFASGRPVTLQIDGQTFNMSTKGEWAWPPSSADDAKIVAAMRRGSKAILTAQSSRGTKTVDTFSLLGFTAASTKASQLCS